jgi:hypothetical protein
MYSMCDCAVPENRALVYKRRIYLPPVNKEDAPREVGSKTASEGSTGSGGGLYTSDAPIDVPDVDFEAEQATSVTDAAHQLAYIDAVYNVVVGNYLVRHMPTCVFHYSQQYNAFHGAVTPARRHYPCGIAFDYN